MNESLCKDLYKTISHYPHGEVTSSKPNVCLVSFIELRVLSIPKPQHANIKEETIMFLT